MHESLGLPVLARAAVTPTARTRGRSKPLGPGPGPLCALRGEPLSGGGLGSDVFSLLPRQSAHGKGKLGLRGPRGLRQGGRAGDSWALLASWGLAPRTSLPGFSDGAGPHRPVPGCEGGAWKRKSLGGGLVNRWQRGVKGCARTGLGKFCSAELRAAIRA